MGYTNNGYWGNGNCARIPSLSTYDEAKKHYISVAPIRGRHPEVRPLGDKRRYAWYEIRENQRAVNDGFLGQWVSTYSCTLYTSHDCVEFYPDGSVIIRAYSWHTPTTQAFINYTTREFGYIESVKGKWYWKQKHDGKMFLLGRGRDYKIILKPNAEGKLEVDNPVKEKKYSVNRKAMNSVRKTYEFFREYCYVMLSMNNEINREEADKVITNLGFPHTNLIGNDYWREVNNTENNRVLLFKHLDKVIVDGDLDLMYDLALYVAYAFGRWSYKASSCICDADHFNKRWVEVLKYGFADEVLVATDVEAGVSFKDPNMKYVAP